MKTQNEFIQHGHVCKEPSTNEVMNDDSITAKVREALEEWNEREKASHLNRFRNPGKNTSAKKLDRPPVKK